LVKKYDASLNGYRKISAFGCILAGIVGKALPRDAILCAKRLFAGAKQRVR